MNARKTMGPIASSKTAYTRALFSAVCVLQAFTNRLVVITVWWDVLHGVIGKTSQVTVKS